jgi:branched-chain amino acid transport system ATP-binding protein
MTAAEPSPEATPALEVEDLEVRYGAVRAVRRVSFDAERGSVVGLIGPDGAGKSTTLKSIMGMVPARTGDVRLAGRSIAGTASDEIARLGIALVPEGRRIYADFTVDENLRLGLDGRRTSAGAADDIRWVSDLFPVVREFARRPAGQLSGGQQQQLAIARALVAGPDVLLLDEPTLGLAPSVVEALFDTLAEIRERGVTIVLVEQRAQLTVAFADRTHVMRNGELVTTLAPGDANDVERITAAYFGQ